LETVIPLDAAPRRDTSGLEPTGVFFYEPTVEALCETVLLFQRQTAAFNAKACRRNALRFDRPLFKARIRAFLAGILGRDIE
jgi:hypothetical protein